MAKAGKTISLQPIAREVRKLRKQLQALRGRASVKGRKEIDLHIRKLDKADLALKQHKVTLKPHLWMALKPHTAKLKPHGMKMKPRSGAKALKPHGL